MPKSPGRRRALRPVFKSYVASEAELRALAQERVYNRLVRSWMSKLQRKELELIVHALPAADRDRFSELASLAMQQASPRARGWAVFAALAGYQSTEKLPALQFCHELGLCELPLDHQLKVLNKLALVAAPLRHDLWATGRLLLGNNKRVARHADLLHSLAVMSPEQWPHFVRLCMPLSGQYWVTKHERIKTILHLAQTCLRPDPPPRPPARPTSPTPEERDVTVMEGIELLGLVAQLTPYDPASPDWPDDLHYQNDHDVDDDDVDDNDDDAAIREYDAENVQRHERISATSVAIVQLRSIVSRLLPAYATLELIEAFVANLKYAPDEEGGYLRHHRAVEPASHNNYHAHHRYSELANATYALHATPATPLRNDLAYADSDLVRSNGLNDSDDDSYTPSIESSRADSDDEMLVGDEDDAADAGDYNADIWSNEIYKLNGDDSIGMAELAALVWTAIDAYTSPELDADACELAKRRMRLDFVSGLASCVEDSNYRVCIIGMTQRLLTCVQHEYGLAVPLYTPQDVVSECARDFSRRYESPESCKPQSIQAFYEAALENAGELFADNADAYNTFQNHLEGYLELELKACTWPLGESKKILPTKKRFIQILHPHPDGYLRLNFALGRALKS